MSHLCVCVQSCERIYFQVETLVCVHIYYVNEL